MKSNNEKKLEGIPDASMSLSPQFREDISSLFEKSQGDISWKLQNFTNYVPRQALSRFLCREEMFRKVLHIQGSIIECGVLGGWGLTSWMHLSSIFEPLNTTRRIIGFDSFEGFPSISNKDSATGTSQYMSKGDLTCDSMEEIKKATEIHNNNTIFKSPEKVILVKGDACNTIPEYIQNNPETIVSLIYLDFDLYEPTKVALECILPRMPKGAIIAFDELNDKGFPGETIALLESHNINKLKIERFTYDTKISYAVIE